jgi:hypothetical protein
MDMQHPELTKFIECEHAIDYVTAEQHAIDNPGHTVRVWYAVEDCGCCAKLSLMCTDCDWFDDQLRPSGY